MDPGTLPLCPACRRGGNRLFRGWTCYGLTPDSQGAGGLGSSQNSSLGDYHWVADPWVFPDGIKGLHDYIKKPLVMHNRWYTPDNWYKAQGIGGDWVGSSSHVLPLDMDTFYEYFFTQQGNFGIATYEQDFMYSQYDAIDALQQNATLADDWLRAMADNAEAHNLTMQ